MSEHLHTTSSLTKNQTLVMGALADATGPLSAYTILDQLRDDGFRAPLQVYRALDKLLEFGLIHRLETLNAFVACRHPGCEAHETIAFMICESCEKVSEITDDAVTKRLKTLATNEQFTLKQTTIEIRGTCNLCKAA